jgi:hypothetical protein
VGWRQNLKEEKHMSRFITAFAIALGCAAITAHAQETTTKTETKSSGGEVKTVTYTGCVQTGTEARSYILDKVVPVTRTTTTETPTSSSTTSSTSYVLVPGERVELQTQVGRKVEVTGQLIPAGNVKTETTTRVDRDDAKDTKTRERVETKNSMPQFRVTSVKQLSDAC